MWKKEEIEQVVRFRMIFFFLVFPQDGSGQCAVCGVCHWVLCELCEPCSVTRHRHHWSRSGTRYSTVRVVSRWWGSTKIVLGPPGDCNSPIEYSPFSSSSPGNRSGTMWLQGP